MDLVEDASPAHLQYEVPISYVYYQVPRMHANQCRLISAYNIKFAVPVYKCLQCLIEYAHCPMPTVPIMFEVPDIQCLCCLYVLHAYMYSFLYTSTLNASASFAQAHLVRISWEAREWKTPGARKKDLSLLCSKFLALLCLCFATCNDGHKCITCHTSLIWNSFHNLAAGCWPLPLLCFATAAPGFATAAPARPSSMNGACF